MESLVDVGRTRGQVAGYWCRHNPNAVWTLRSQLRLKRRHCWIVGAPTAHG